MAQYESVETQTIAVTNVSKAATFEGGIQSVVLSCDADCFVDFDIPAIASSSLLVKANLEPVQIDFGGGNIKQVTAICGGTANLYILGIRGK